MSSLLSLTTSPVLATYPAQGVSGYLLTVTVAYEETEPAARVRTRAVLNPKQLTGSSNVFSSLYFPNAEDNTFTIDRSLIEVDVEYFVLVTVDYANGSSLRTNTEILVGSDVPDTPTLLVGGSTPSILAGAGRLFLDLQYLYGSSVDGAQLSVHGSPLTKILVFLSLPNESMTEVVLLIDPSDDYTTHMPYEILPESGPLLNGVSYEVAILVESALGSAAMSNTVFIAPLARPDACPVMARALMDVNPSAVSPDTQVVCFFDAPTNILTLLSPTDPNLSPVPVLSYTLTLYFGSGPTASQQTVTVDAADVTSNPYSNAGTYAFVYLATAPSIGTPVQFSVVATNINGAGTPSNLSNSVRPWANPLPPTQADMSMQMVNSLYTGSITVSVPSTAMGDAKASNTTPTSQSAVFRLELRDPTSGAVLASVGNTTFTRVSTGPYTALINVASLLSSTQISYKVYLRAVGTSPNSLEPTVGVSDAMQVLPTLFGLSDGSFYFIRYPPSLSGYVTYTTVDSNGLPWARADVTGQSILGPGNYGCRLQITIPNNVPVFPSSVVITASDGTTGQWLSSTVLTAAPGTQQSLFVPVATGRTSFTSVKVDLQSNYPQSIDVASAAAFINVFAAEQVAPPTNVAVSVTSLTQWSVSWTAPSNAAVFAPGALYNGYAYRVMVRASDGTLVGSNNGQLVASDTTSATVSFPAGTQGQYVAFVGTYALFPGSQLNALLKPLPAASATFANAVTPGQVSGTKYFRVGATTLRAYYDPVSFTGGLAPLVVYKLFTGVAATFNIVSPDFVYAEMQNLPSSSFSPFMTVEITQTAVPNTISASSTSLTSNLPISLVNTSTPSNFVRNGPVSGYTTLPAYISDLPQVPSAQLVRAKVLDATGNLVPTNRSLCIQLANTANNLVVVPNNDDHPSFSTIDTVTYTGGLAALFTAALSASVSFGGYQITANTRVSDGAFLLYLTSANISSNDTFLVSRSNAQGNLSANYRTVSAGTLGAASSPVSSLAGNTFSTTATSVTLSWPAYALAYAFSYELTVETNSTPSRVIVQQRVPSTQQTATLTFDSSEAALKRVYLRIVRTDAGIDEYVTNRITFSNSTFQITTVDMFVPVLNVVPSDGQVTVSLAGNSSVLPYYAATPEVSLSVGGQSVFVSNSSFPYSHTFVGFSNAVSTTVTVSIPSQSDVTMQRFAPVTVSATPYGPVIVRSSEFSPAPSGTATEYTLNVDLQGSGDLTELVFLVKSPSDPSVSVVLFSGSTLPTFAPVQGYVSVVSCVVDLQVPNVTDVLVIAINGTSMDSQSFPSDSGAYFYTAPV
jgi:hypothetical protein